MWKRQNENPERLWLGTWTQEMHECFAQYVHTDINHHETFKVLQRITEPLRTTSRHLMSLRTQMKQDPTRTTVQLHSTKMGPEGPTTLTEEVTVTPIHTQPMESQPQTERPKNLKRPKTRIVKTNIKASTIQTIMPPHTTPHELHHPPQHKYNTRCATKWRQKVTHVLDHPIKPHEITNKLAQNHAQGHPWCYIHTSTLPGAGLGLFVNKIIPPHTKVCSYEGKRHAITPQSTIPADPTYCCDVWDVDTPFYIDAKNNDTSFGPFACDPLDPHLVNSYLCVVENKKTHQVDVEVWTNDQTITPHEEVFIDYGIQEWALLYAHMSPEVQARINSRWPNMKELLKDRQKLESNLAWTIMESLESSDPSATGTPDVTQPAEPSPLAPHDTSSDKMTPSKTETSTVDPSNQLPSYKTDTPTDGNCGPAACILATTYEYWKMFNHLPEQIPTIIEARRLLARHLVQHSWTSLESEGKDELFPKNCAKTEEEKVHSLIHEKIWLTQATCDILTQVLWTKYLATEGGLT